MTWSDLLLSKSVERNVLARILEECVGVADIRLVDSITELASTATPSVSCLMSQFEEGFPLMLSLYPSGLNEKDLPTQEAVSKALSKAGECQVLFDDYSSNPYLMNMVECGGETQLVSFDLDLYSRGYYSISSK